jgi:hypothetical protein
MLIELQISSSPFCKCPRVHPFLCGGIHESEDLFVIPPGVTFNFPTDGAIVNCWLYFPGVKVGKIYLYSSFWQLDFVDYTVNR